MAFPTGWGYYQKITIQNTKIPGTLTDYPFTVTRDHLDDDVVDPSGSNNAQADGGDIRFSSDSAGATQLACEIVKFEHDTSTAAGDAVIEINVKVPSVSSSVDTDVYIWYDTSGSDTQPAVTDTYGRNNVWDSNFLGVYHMEEDPSGTAPQMIDSTGASDGTSSGSMTSGDSISGAFGSNALDLDGSNDKIDTNSATLDASSGTIEWWIDPTGTHNDSTIMRYWTMSAGGTPELSAQKYSDNNFYIGWNGSGGDDRVVLAASSGNYTQSWQSYVFTWASSGTSYFRRNDTALGNNGGGTSVYSLTNNMLMGGGISGDYFSGGIDEYRFSDTVRSSDYLTATYNNQSAPSTFALSSTPVSTAAGGATGKSNPLMGPLGGPLAGPLGM